MSELDADAMSGDGSKRLGACVEVVLATLHLNVNAPYQVADVLVEVFWLEYKAPVDLGQNQFAVIDKTQTHSTFFVCCGFFFFLMQPTFHINIVSFQRF